ncbi:NAD(P)-binding protein [Nonomuraea lactucae]|uniref:NAD(P)-binding protein n=1 Tax=Nonomuraea lactucae TaxID=2249762 RepID=UPI003B82E004
MEAIAGLAAGYYLRRARTDFVILDAAEQPGGAWQHAWDSLRLFSPAPYRSLPGRMMPQPAGGGCPRAAHAVAYRPPRRMSAETSGRPSRRIGSDFDATA